MNCVIRGFRGNRSSEDYFDGYGVCWKYQMVNEWKNGLCPRDSNVELAHTEGECLINQS